MIVGPARRLYRKRRNTRVGRLINIFFIQDLKKSRPLQVNQCIMKQVTLHIPEKKYRLFIEFAKSVSFIKKIEIEDEASTKKQVLEGVR